MDITVIKRNGTKEKLDISKIQKYTSASTIGLHNVSKSELEMDAQIVFTNGVKTADIQMTLIKTAVDKIDIDRPDWTFVASRLFLYDLYHKVTKTASYDHLRNTVERAKKFGRYQIDLGDKYDLDDLNNYIDISRDYNFNYLGIKTFYDRYILKDDEGNPIELPQHLFMGVAMFLAQNEEDKQGWAKKFYDILSKFEVMSATPTLSNARTQRSQCSSCYIGSTPDSIEGIFDTYKEMALLSKFGGGIGWDWNNVRGTSSVIDGNSKAAAGFVPFLKITNDLALAVDQLGTRKGAIAVYTEPWHIDIRAFLDLKRNSGEERHRTHDLFPAVWLNDLFMERAKNDELWTLFDPVDVPELSELYGEEFREQYEHYESEDSIRKEVISAKNLWKIMLREYFETGNPFLTFKDTANRANPNKHAGVIRSSNLCTEIFQNTSPDTEAIKVLFEDLSEEIYTSKETVTTDTGIVKQPYKLIATDSINGKRVYVTEKIKIDGETAVCNLMSVNLSKINTKEDIERVVPIAIRMLDNVIDLNFYPYKKIKDTNMRNRAIGLGVMGESQMLAENRIMFGTTEHFSKIDELMETISYVSINSSCDLAIEKGSYPMFEGSDWSNGIFPIDHANEKALTLVSRDHIYDWDSLRVKVIDNGLRNGYLMAIAPTSSISILCGTTQTIEPVYKRKWFEENLSGLIPVTAPNINSDTWSFYVPAYDVDQINIIKGGAVRQKWIDQGQSLNIFVDPNKASGKYLNEIYMTGWEYGLKSTYYLRSQSPEAVEEVNDRTTECIGCQ